MLLRRSGQLVAGICTNGDWKCAVYDAGYKQGTDTCNPCPIAQDAQTTDSSGADVPPPDGNDAAGPDLESD